MLHKFKNGHFCIFYIPGLNASIFFTTTANDRGDTTGINLFHISIAAAHPAHPCPFPHCHG